MPLTRYRVRNEYSLADPELYRAADKDDPEALLEGVAMAGLVGVLRQLGDLAEFAAEIFHGLHEEVMATAARGHGLMVRVQQLEAEFPPIEKAFLCQTSHSSFFYNTGVYWHPNLHMDQNLIMKGDLPRFVMDSYEECRGPPRLSLLDKYDVVGAGACSKRYTDPSFFKVHSPTSGMRNAEVQKEKKTRKAKKKGSRWRNGETPKVLPTSHAKLHQLFLEENVENHVNNPARRVKLKRRLNGFPFDSKTAKSYMEKFLTPNLAHSVCEIPGNSSPLKLPSNIPDESGIKILEISTVSPEKESLQRKRSLCSSPDATETGHQLSMDKLNEEINYRISEVPKLNPNIEAHGVLSTFHDEVDEKEIIVDGESKKEGDAYSHHSDDIARELENSTDVLTTMDSEMETETVYRAKNDLQLPFNITSQGRYYNANEEQQDLQAHFSDSLSIGNSTATDDENSSCRKGISSFSCSDSLTDLAENMSPHGDASTKVLPFTGVCEAQIVNTSPYRCSVNKEHMSTQPLEHMICNGVCNGETEIASIGEPSSGSCVTDSGPALLPVDIGKGLMKGASVGPELDEISSELNAGRIDPEENNICMGDNLPCTCNISDSPSQARDDFLPMFTETHPGGDIDDEDPHVLSHASVHLSDNFQLSPEKKSSEILLGNVLQAEYAEECVKNSIDSQIDSLHSVASPTEEQPLHSAMPELETFCTDISPDGCVSEVDDAPPLSRERAISSVPVLDSPQASKFTGQQHPEMTRSVPPLEPDSEEICFSHSRKNNLDRAFKGVDDEESGGFSSDTDIVGEVVANVKIPSDFQKSSDTPPILEVRVHLDDVVTETVRSEAVVVATTFSNTHCDDKGAAGKSMSTSPKMVLEESIPILQDLLQNISENNEACSEEHLQESGTEKGDQQDTLDSVMCNTAYNDSKSDLLNNVPDTCMAAISGNTFHNVGGTSFPLSVDQDDQASESKPPRMINIIEDTEAVVSSPSHHIAELRTPLEQKFELQADHFDVGSQHAAKEVSDLFFRAAQTQSPNYLDLDAESNASSKFCAAHLPSQPLVSGFVPQRDASVQAVDPSSSALSSFGLLMEASQINADEMPPLPPLPPMQWRIGKVQHAALAPEKDLVQHTLDLFPQILHSMTDKQAHLDHSAIEGEVTPLQNPFLPQAAVKEGNSQYGYNNFTGCMVHSNPLSLQVPTMVNRNHGNNGDDAAVKEDNSQYGYDNNLAGYRVHSDPLSLQVATMVNHNHGNNGDDFTTSGKTQSTNPLLVLPTIFNERSEHGFLSSEGGTAVTAQPAPSTFLQVTNIEDKVSTCPPTSLQEKLVLPLHQVPSQKSSEDNTLQCAPEIPEGEVVNTSDTTSLSLAGLDNQPLPKHVFSSSEGKTAWPSSTCVPVAAFEDGMPNGNHQRKLPRPRNPLIDAVIAHDKSKLRKVTERVEPQVGHKLDERDSLLEQIRAKSFNLKPAVMARPSIRGPKTNLKVAAILEKASAIRQALAGSDEDDEADGWSDS